MSKVTRLKLLMWFALSKKIFVFCLMLIILVVILFYHDQASVFAQAEMEYSYLTGYLNSDTWAVPEDGWYKIYSWGRSGNGSAGTNVQSSIPYSGGTGGGSGGFSASLYFLEMGTEVSITINSTQTLVSVPGETQMVATGGTDSTTHTSIGQGGTASGGNLANLAGFKGGQGSTGNNTATDGSAGGNSGARGGISGNPSNLSSYGKGGGGGGGAQLPGGDHCNYVADDMATKYSGGAGGNSGNQFLVVVLMAQMELLEAVFRLLF